LLVAFSTNAVHPFSHIRESGIGELRIFWKRLRRYCKLFGFRI
jgi:hypothetical protein